MSNDEGFESGDWVTVDNSDIKFQIMADGSNPCWHYCDCKGQGTEWATLKGAPDANGYSLVLYHVCETRMVHTTPPGDE